MISEEYYVFNVKTGKKLYGSFNKEESLSIAKNLAKLYPKDEFQINRIITYIDSIYNNKHND